MKVYQGKLLITAHINEIGEFLMLKTIDSRTCKIFHEKSQIGSERWPGCLSSALKDSQLGSARKILARLGLGSARQIPARLPGVNIYTRLLTAEK